MKTTITSLSFLLACLFQAAFAQQTSNLVVFSENGETFTLTVNGVIQNDQPATNVTAEGLTGDFQRVSVQFEDATLGTASQNFAIEPGTEQKAVIKLRKKGGYAIRPFGEPVPLARAEKAPAPPAPTPPAQREETVRTSQPELGGKVTTTTTTTTIQEGRGSETVRMDVGLGDQRMGINVEINDPTMTGGTTTTTVQTTETLTTTSEGTITKSPETAPAVKEEPICGPMEAAAFNSAKRSIGSKSFADEKKTTARQVLRSSCMSTDQIIEVMGLFSFEDDKLEFAKTAYDRCSDPQNYWKINDAFTFSDSIEALDEFLESK